MIHFSIFGVDGLSVRRYLGLIGTNNGSRRDERFNIGSADGCF